MRSKLKLNLNDYFYEAPQAHSSKGEIAVDFYDHERRVCDFINRSDIIVGCSFYLTNAKIIESLERSQGASIIIDKSAMIGLYNFIGERWKCKTWNGKKYHKAKSYYEDRFKSIPLMQYNFIHKVNQYLDNEYDHPVKVKESVRYFGSSNSSVKLHHKFLVSCSAEYDESGDVKKLNPKSVLTGSYNFTGNANRNRETLITIFDTNVANEFFLEWERAFLLSERNSSEIEFKPDLIPFTNLDDLKRLMKEEEDSYLQKEIDFYDIREYARDCDF